MKRLLLLGIFGTCSGLTSFKAFADPFVVDQAKPFNNCAGGCTGLNIQVFSQIGQSFTPTLGSLNDVELVVSPGGLVLPSDLKIEIRAGTITGAILGTASSPSYSSTGFLNFDLAHFDFGSTISLVPGGTYVITVIAPTTTAFLEGQFDGYAGGTGFEFGAPVADLDFYFREGPSVPEPSSVLLLASIVGAAIWIRRQNR
jgi:hypothetical protein